MHQEGQSLVEFPIELTGCRTETVTVARLPISDAKERERGSEPDQLRSPSEGWITRRQSR